MDATAARDDMANVGEALMEALRDHASSPNLKGWAPADCPSEIVGDLLNMLDERATENAALRTRCDALAADMGAIHDLLDGEIAARFRQSSSQTESEQAGKSLIYSLLVVPRNMARAALALHRGAA